jgi:hypothetical protein
MPLGFMCFTFIFPLSLSLSQFFAHHSCWLPPPSPPPATPSSVYEVPLTTMLYSWRADPNPISPSLPNHRPPSVTPTHGNNSKYGDDTTELHPRTATDNAHHSRTGWPNATPGTGKIRFL